MNKYSSKNYKPPNKAWEDIPEYKNATGFSTYLNKELGIQILFSLGKRENIGAEVCLYVTIAAVKNLRKDISKWIRYLTINSSFVLKEFFPELKFTREKEDESRIHFYCVIESKE
jgi:hypothetical protein